MFPCDFRFESKLLGTLLLAGWFANAALFSFNSCSRKNTDAVLAKKIVAASPAPTPIQSVPAASTTPANPNLADAQGRTPLMLAAASGDTAALQKLLDAGANPALTDRQGHTALFLVLQAGKIDAGKALLQPDSARAELIQNAAGLLPLAVQTGDRDLLVQMLHFQPHGLFWQDSLSRRFVQALWEKDAELVHLLRAAHTTPPHLPGHAQTLLAYTVAWNAPDQTRLLIESGTTADEPLVPAVDPDFLNLLNSPRLRSMAAKDQKVTPLILAAGLGYGEVLRVLLQAGANPYTRTSSDLSAVNFIGNQPALLDQLIASKDPRQAPYRVKIDLSEQWAYYYEQNHLIMKCIVSSGKPGFETPAGRFFITDKDRSKMSSIYDVEMPYFMRLNGSAVGLHSGPTNGHPISHGCVRMPDPAAKMLFERAPIGTLVTIQE